MIALHAIWSRDSRMCVWGEDSVMPPRAPACRGRRPTKPRPREHPFACAAETVAGALGRVCPELNPGMMVERRAPVLLPSFRHGPQPSPHLLRADEDPAAARRPDLLHPWVVPAAGFASAQAATFRWRWFLRPRPGAPITLSPVEFSAALLRLASLLLLSYESRRRRRA